jgi:hypothetical protein
VTLIEIASPEVAAVRRGRLKRVHRITSRVGLLLIGLGVNAQFVAGILEP